jgi:RHS repeat-associated protein
VGHSNNVSYAGLLAQVTDPNGFSTHYAYDPFGRLARIFRGWDEQGGDFSKPSSFYRYYDFGSFRLHNKPWMIFVWNKTQNGAAIASTGGTWERQFYDGFGNLIQTQRPHTDWGGSGIGQEIVTDMRYDSQGHLLWQSAPRFAPAYVHELIGDLIKNPYKMPNFSNTIVSQYSATGELVRRVGLDGAVSSAIYGLRSLYQQDGNNNLRASFFDATGQLAAVDEMLAVFSDNFDHNNPALPGWNGVPNATVSNGRVTINGNSTGASFARTMANTPGYDAASIFTFRLSQPSANAQIFLDNGLQTGHTDYRRWSLKMTGGNLMLEEWNNPAPPEATTLMPLQADTDYRVMLRRSQSDTNFALLVWQVSNPANRAEIRLPKDATWKSGDWRFFIQVYTAGAVLEFDDYAEADIYRTRYRYDITGNLTQVNDALGNETLMTYDGLGRKRFMHDPDMGDWYYTYDAAGNLTSQTDANLQTLFFDYDKLNRLTKKLLGANNGPPLATYLYDVTTGGNKGIGRRTSMTAYDPPGVPHNSASWTYDTLGRVTQETRSFANGGQSYTFQFGYTEGDLPVTLRYPGGAAIQPGEIVTTTYSWQTGQPRTLVGDGTYVTQATYGFAHGQVSRLEMPTSSFNTTYTYDTAFRLNSIRTASAGHDRFWQALNYDRAGNVISIQDNTPPGGGTVQWQYFAYDSLNRLTSAYTSGGNEGQYNETYGYDALGNLIDKAGVCMGYWQEACGVPTGASAPREIKPHAVTHLNGIQQFWYDANGNMTRRIADLEWTLTWTPENMPRSATDSRNTVTFAYDADGMMVQRTENGQTTNRLGKLFEHNVTLDSFTKHYQFGGRLIAMREGLSAGSAVSFFATDHLGSTAVTIWANGSVRSQLRYDPWGQERYAQHTTPTGYRYTSQRWDSGLGLYDYNARYYDPHIGKFISPDTFIPAPYSPQSLSRYTYVYNNPLLYNDPTGHFVNLGFAAVGAVVGAAVGAVVATAPQMIQNVRDGAPLTANIEPGQVATAVVAGAVAGGIGGLTFGVGLAVMGTGAAATVASGAAAGAVAGQAGRATGNVLSGDSLTQGLGNPVDIAIDATAGAVLAGVGYGIQQLARSGPSTTQVLQRLANQADAAVPGRGAVAGTQKHAAFRDLVRGLNRADLHAEQTILPGGRPANYGTRGAIRLDVIEGPLQNPIAVYDLKTGSAQLSPARIQQIRNYYQNPNLPVIQIKPY